VCKRCTSSTSGSTATRSRRRSGMLQGRHPVTRPAARSTTNTSASTATPVCRPFVECYRSRFPYTVCKPVYESARPGSPVRELPHGGRVVPGRDPLYDLFGRCTSNTSVRSRSPAPARSMGLPDRMPNRDPGRDDRGRPVRAGVRGGSGRKSGNTARARFVQKCCPTRATRAGGQPAGAVPRARGHCRRSGCRRPSTRR